jgi:hypothetical protein
MPEELICSPSTKALKELFPDSSARVYGVRNPRCQRTIAGELAVTTIDAVLSDYHHVLRTEKMARFV